MQLDDLAAQFGLRPEVSHAALCGLQPPLGGGTMTLDDLCCWRRGLAGTDRPCPGIKPV